MIITIESGVVLFVEDVKKYKACKLQGHRFDLNSFNL